MVKKICHCISLAIKLCESLNVHALRHLQVKQSFVKTGNIRIHFDYYVDFISFILK